MLVRDHMSVPPITIRSDADYKSALQLMRDHAVHHVPVLAPGGALAGILAERDLLLAATHYLQSGVEVSEVMHREVVVVTPETPLAHAAELLARHKIGGLPVVGRRGEVVGVITETDVLAAFVDVLTAKELPAAPQRAARATGKRATAKKVTRNTARRTQRRA